MIIVENYNTCKQKYGEDLTLQMANNGIPPNFLLAACRFYVENNIQPKDLVPLFKDWNSYVLKYNPKDVNKVPYEEFRNTISREKLKHCLPNPVVVTDNAALGRLDTVKDARVIPVESTWCIKARARFDSILHSGDELYAIYLPTQPEPFTYNIALVQRGNVAFWNSDNKRQFEYGSDPAKNLHEIFLTKLPSEIYNYLYNRAEEQRNKRLINCNTNMKNKQVVRLTEGQLHNIIVESVSKILEAWDNDKYKEAMENPRYRKMMDKVDSRTYADRNRGINAFGRKRNDDFRTMQKGACDSWERDYGYFNDNGGHVLDAHTHTPADTGKKTTEYTVRRFRKDGNTTEYYPKKNTVVYDNAYDYGNRNDTFHKRQATDKDLSNNPGWDIAKQMQNGSDGKGWRNNG